MFNMHIFKNRFELTRDKLSSVVSTDCHGLGRGFKDFIKGLINPFRSWLKRDRKSNDYTGIIINYRKDISRDKVEYFNRGDIHLPYLMWMISDKAGWDNMHISFENLFNSSWRTFYGIFTELR